METVRQVKRDRQSESANVKREAEQRTSKCGKIKQILLIKQNTFPNQWTGCKGMRKEAVICLTTLEPG